MGLRLILLAVIIALNAFFAAAEVALVSVRRSRLRARADQGETGAIIALQLIDNPERLLSVSQVGMTLTSLGLGWAGEGTIFELIIGVLHPVITPETTKVLHALSFVVAFFFISFLHIIVGEVIPKNLALDKPDRLSVLLAPPLLVFQRVIAPFVWIVERSSGWVTKHLGLARTGHGTGGHSAEELKFIVRISRTEGHLETFEEDAIQKLLALQDISAREIMVPRNTIVAVPVEASLDDVLRTMLEHKYSRVPVYEGSTEKIIGVLHYKDLMRAWQERRLAIQNKRNERPFRIRRYIRRKLVVPESKPLNQLVDEFRQNQTHMAIVVDEFGTISGVVTLEDVFEQIFGEIADEHDQRIEIPKMEALSVDVEGTIPIRDLSAMYQIDLPGDAGFETLAGFLLFKLGYIPKPGESIEYGGRKFSIMEMDRNRIAKVRIDRLELSAGAVTEGKS
jgi:CBS domain containing-hemolysin-like protein